MERKEAIFRLNQLKGSELHALAEKYNVTVYKDGKVNKGWAGHVCERYLELPINSAQSPNFGSWELKVVPLKIKKNGELAIKETMAITMIDPVNVCQKDFENSHLLAKLRKQVVVFRIVGKHVDEPSFIHSIVEFNLSLDMYTEVKADYDLVRDTLQKNNMDITVLSGKMGKHIQPRTKGQGHGSISRAFYARTSFLALFAGLK